jgi:hypothetical protein
VPVISGIRIEFQINMGVLGETKFLYIPVPMTDAEEKFFDVIVGRINPEIAVIDVELQNSVMHE